MCVDLTGQSQSLVEPLTDREREVLQLIAQGHSNPEIADILGIANGTVRNHISNIYAKLEVDNREAAVRAAGEGTGVALTASALSSMAPIAVKTLSRSASAIWWAWVT